MIRIMIVDDDVLLAMELEEHLNSKGYDVVGVVESGVEAVNRVRDLQPDLILMDIKMPGKLDGIDSAERIMGDYDIPVIFVTGYSDEEVIKRAKRLYPLGYITKLFNETQIPAAIEIGLYNREKEKRYQNAANPGFTPQERTIAKFVGEGKSTKEIAEVLCVCDETVRWHRKNMRRKLGISEKNTSLMAALSYSAKELSPSDREAESRGSRLNPDGRAAECHIVKVAKWQSGFFLEHYMRMCLRYPRRTHKILPLGMHF